MKIRLISLLAAVAMVLSLAGCDDNKADKPFKIAVINSERVIAESVAGKAGSAHMNAVSGELQAQLVKLRAEYEADPKNKELEKKLQQGFVELQQRFAEQQAFVNAKLNEAYQKALVSFREKHGIDIVLPAESVLSSGPRADMTAQLIAEFDKFEVSFAAPAQEQPPAGAAAPVQAAPEAQGAVKAPADTGQAPAEPQGQEQKQ